MSENAFISANTSQKQNTTSLPQHNETENHATQRFVFAAAASVAAILVNIAYEKWASKVPDWLFILLCLVPLSLWCYWAWTHERIKKHRRLIYTYPIVSLLIMIIVGMCAGGSFGVLLWWSVYRQPSTAVQAVPTTQPIIEEVKLPEVRVDDPKPNLIPVSYGKRHIVYDPTTQTFKESDSGILTVVAQFRNAHERSKKISEANDIRAHIYYEPSEFYKNLDKNIPGFTKVDDGIWLDEKQFLVNFKRGETKTLILAVQMPDGGFGAFDYRFEKADGPERLLPRVPKLTADKYVVKVQLTGEANGDIDELYHFQITLRPEFNISF